MGFKRRVRRRIIRRGKHRLSSEDIFYLIVFAILILSLITYGFKKYFHPVKTHHFKYHQSKS